MLLSLKDVKNEIKLYPLRFPVQFLFPDFHYFLQFSPRFHLQDFLHYFLHLQLPHFHHFFLRSHLQVFLLLFKRLLSKILNTVSSLVLILNQNFLPSFLSSSTFPESGLLSSSDELQNFEVKKINENNRFYI